MRILKESILSRNENIIFRKIEDEYILVPMLASSDEVEHIFNLNQVGAAIWDRIDGERTVKEIIDELILEYEGDPEQIEEDVIDFLRDILEAKIVEVRNEGS